MSVDVVSHAIDFMNELDRKAVIALEEIGIIAEKYAKANCPVGTPQYNPLKMSGHF